MRLKHIATGKVYEWKGFVGSSLLDPRDIVYVRTNAEVYPEQFYDFSPSQKDGCTMYYVREPLSDFEVIDG